MDKDKAPERQVRIQFGLKKEEYVRGVRYYLRKSHLVSWVQLVLGLAVLAAVAALTWMMGRLNFLNTLLLVLMVLVGGYGAYLYFLRPGRYYAKHPELGREAAYVFSKEDFARQDDKAAAIYDWNVKKLWRTKEFYFLFTGGEGYTMLPRRAFASEQDWERFQEIVYDAVPGLEIRDFS